MKYRRYCPTSIDKATHPHLALVSMCWQTEDGKYDILFDNVNGFRHLRISRMDDQPIYNYMDLQEIKNDLWGEDTVAVEVYPQQGDFKNGSNTYHLWTWDGIIAPNLAKLYKYKDAPQEAVESGEKQQATQPVTPCQHKWKSCGSGFLFNEWECEKCGEVTDDCGTFGP